MSAPYSRLDVERLTANVPPELLDGKRLVCWRLAMRNGKATKPPVDPYTGRDAEADNPATWSPVADALDYYIKHSDEIHGVGRVIATGDGYVGIDFDNCLDENANLIPNTLAAKWLPILNSYTERSPSGRGVKVWLRAMLGDDQGRRKQPKLGVEIYPELRYFTLTGDRLAQFSNKVEERHFALDAFYADVFGSKTERQDHTYKSSTTGSDAEIIDRAMNFANGARFRRVWNGDWSDYGTQSEADLALCSLLWFASGGDRAATEYLFTQSELGQRDKWQKRADYRRRTLDAACTGEYWTPPVHDQPPRECRGSAGKPNEAAPDEPSDQWPEPMSDDAFYGLAGDFVRLVEQETEADRHALLLSFLTIFSCAVGRKPYFLIEATRHHCNLFCVLVGKTASGRKGTAVDRADNIFWLADPDFLKLCKRSGLSSGEGLIQAIRDKREDDVIVDKGKTSQCVERKVVDNGVDDKRLLVVETEFASVLQQNSREGNILFCVLRNGWDSKPLQVLARSNKDTCQEPHIATLNNVTPEDLFVHLTSTDKANGFGNRFLWCLSRRSKKLPHGGRELDPVKLQKLASGLKKALRAAKETDRVEWSEAAYAAWVPVYDTLTQDADGLYGAMIARAAPQVLRIAMIYALLDCSKQITTQHLNAALEVWDYCDDSVRIIFGDAIGNETADIILRLLRNAPDGLTRTEINRAFGSHKSSRELDVALSLLEKKHKVWKKEESTGGAPVTRWGAYA